jgi:hypothetical protein
MNTQIQISDAHTQLNWHWNCLSDLTVCGKYIRATKSKRISSEHRSGQGHFVFHDAQLRAEMRIDTLTVAQLVEKIGARTLSNIHVLFHILINYVHCL